MKEVLLLIVFTLLVYTVNGERRYNKLKFGQTPNDYILFQTDMSPFETGFTLCSWIRKLNDDQIPTWFDYAVSNGRYEIGITDKGERTSIFGYRSDLSSYYTVTPGNWFHNCMSWDAATRTRNIYIDGVLVDSRSTPAGRTLKQGGYIVLGNEQQGGPGSGMDDTNDFGGEMYNLNMFSRKFTDSEIQEMARERCSGVEDLYGEVRRLKWEEILLKSRNGNVTEIGSGCNASAINSRTYSHQLVVGILNGTLKELESTKEEKETYKSELDTKWQLLNETVRELEQTKANFSSKVQQLNSTETELKETKEDLGTCQVDLVTEKEQLNATNVELQQSKAQKETLFTNLETKEEQLNATEVELQQSKEKEQNCQTELTDISQQLNTTEAQKQTKIAELKTTNTELDNTTAALNRTQFELEQVRELLKNTANSTLDCRLNTTVTSHWDLLYSEEFLGDVITTQKIEVLRKSIQKLEYFEGITVTEGLIRFLKLFHDGEEQCPN